MKKTSSSNELVRYTTQMYLGMFSGLLLLAAIVSCFGMAGNWLDLTCFLSFSLISSALCMFASEQA